MSVSAVRSVSARASAQPVTSSNTSASSSVGSSQSRGAGPLAVKRRKAYSVRDKLSAIDRVKAGETQVKVSGDLGIPESTLRGWYKDAEKLERYVHNIDNIDGLDRKKTRTAKDTLLDSVLFSWFIQERERGIPVSGTTLKLQAEKLNRELNGENNFKASPGWLYRFQKRHSIRQNDDTSSQECWKRKPQEALKFENQKKPKTTPDAKPKCPASIVHPVNAMKCMHELHSVPSADFTLTLSSFDPLKRFTGNTTKTVQDIIHLLDDTEKGLDLSSSLVADVDHQKLLGESVFQLWKENLLLDLTLDVNGICIAVHKLVLGAVSPFFQRDSIIKGRDLDKVSIKVHSTVQRKTVEAFVRYIYTGQLILSPQSVVGMKHIAQALDMLKLVNICDSFIEAEGLSRIWMKNLNIVRDNGMSALNAVYNNQTVGVEDEEKTEKIVSVDGSSDPKMKNSESQHLLQPKSENVSESEDESEDEDSATKDGNRSGPDTSNLMLFCTEKFLAEIRKQKYQDSETPQTNVCNNPKTLSTDLPSCKIEDQVAGSPSEQSLSDEISLCKFSPQTEASGTERLREQVSSIKSNANNSGNFESGNCSASGAQPVTAPNSSTVNPGTPDVEADYEYDSDSIDSENTDESDMEEDNKSDVNSDSDDHSTRSKSCSPSEESREQCIIDHHDGTSKPVYSSRDFNVYHTS